MVQALISPCILILCSFHLGINHACVVMTVFDYTRLSPLSSHQNQHHRISYVINASPTNPVPILGTVPKRHENITRRPTIIHVTNPPHLALNPSPFPTTSFLGNTSTVRLNNRLSSGVMTLVSSSFFFPASFFFAGDLAAAALPASVPVVVPVLDSPASGSEVSDDLPARSRGAEGKLPFLSMASTRRWKRLKRASARMRVDSRSMVPESSFTVSGCQRWW